MKTTLKKGFSVFLSIVLLISTLFAMDITVATAATKGSCGDNAEWSYNVATSTLTISGTGATKDYNAVLSKVPWESYKPLMTKLVVNEGITVIGNYSFYNCVKLTSVSLPSTLTALNGQGTMTTSYGCFQNCTALESITLPKNLQTIGNCVFKDCTSLKTIRFPDSLTTLSYGAFSGCTALESVVFGSGLTETGDNSFYNAGVKRITWGENITSISAYSFFGCGMTSIDIPDQVTSIGLRALADCSFLTTVTVNNANMAFTGDPCNGSEQSITIRGHNGSTAETYATEKNYKFESIDSCNHTTTHDVVSVEPTCTEKGTLQHICDECGQITREEAIEVLGHNYEEIERVDNTEADGHIYKTNKCARCRDIQDVIEHQKTPEGTESTTRYVWVDGFYEYTNTATCTSPGIARYTCTVEGCKMLGNIATQETVDVALNNHTFEISKVIAEPTCTEVGSAEEKCSVCGLVQTKELPALGHKYDANNLIETVDNTLDDGHIHSVYQCQVCNEQVVSSEHIEWMEGFYTPEIVSQAHCVVNGLEKDTCTVCGATRNVTIQANGKHEWYITAQTEPSCTSVGKVYYACKNCTMTKSDDIAALEHDYVLVEESSTAPTCITPGTDYYKCSRCTAIKQNSIAKLGHTPDENNYTVVQEATCEEDGSFVSVCTVCGQQFTDVIPTFGHTYEDVAVDLTPQDKPGHSFVTPTCKVCGTTGTATTRHDEWIEGYYTNEDGPNSTCNVAGHTTDRCTICSETRENPKPVLGHNYNVTGTVDENGIQYRCSICLRSKYFDSSDVLSYWNSSLLNSRVINRTGPEDKDYTSMLDANGDGIINGKDYAILHNGAKKQAKAVEELQKLQEVNIKITVNNQSFDAVLYSNKTAQALAAMLPLNVEMNELNGNEKYCYLNSTLTGNSEAVGQINNGDIMLFGNNCLVLFYDTFETQYKYTKLGRVLDPTGLADALGTGNVTVSFELSPDPPTDEGTK